MKLLALIFLCIYVEGSKLLSWLDQMILDFFNLNDSMILSHILEQQFYLCETIFFWHSTDMENIHLLINSNAPSFLTENAELFKLY